ncbi:hypothetical protein TorRG33x02_244330 [Trema orientale]|uniref:Uncharacterized protein n=1 Tax=Trema orientale TaxID=63057 RepID=A0A2P5DRC3_TREOI|nr:hypothetical protein TorRG33x02_244330 [Trema orientale]
MGVKPKFPNQIMKLFAMKNDPGVSTSGQSCREGELVRDQTRAPHLVKERKSLKGFARMEASSDVSGPSDDVFGHVFAGGGEQEQASVDEATSGAGVEEVGEEERERNVVVFEKLGVNLGGIFRVLS